MPPRRHAHVFLNKMCVDSYSFIFFCKGISRKKHGVCTNSVRRSAPCPIDGLDPLRNRKISTCQDDIWITDSTTTNMHNIGAEFSNLTVSAGGQLNLQTGHLSGQPAHSLPLTIIAKTSILTGDLQVNGNAGVVGSSLQLNCLGSASTDSVFGVNRATANVVQDTAGTFTMTVPASPIGAYTMLVTSAGVNPLGCVFSIAGNNYQITADGSWIHGTHNTQFRSFLHWGRSYLPAT